MSAFEPSGAKESYTYPMDPKTAPAANIPTVRVRFAAGELSTATAAVTAVGLLSRLASAFKRLAGAAFSLSSNKSSCERFTPLCCDGKIKAFSPLSEFFSSSISPCR